MSLIGILVLAAAPVAADAPASAPPTGQCQVFAARPVSRSNARPERQVSWSAHEVVDLGFETRLRPDADASGIELRVYTPRGNLYRKLNAAAPSSSDEPASSGGAKRRRPSNRARAVMPVSGTGIVRNGLYGEWRVVPHVKGEARPCGRPFSFTIQP